MKDCGRQRCYVGVAASRSQQSILREFRNDSARSSLTRSDSTVSADDRRGRHGSYASSPSRASTKTPFDDDSARPRYRLVSHRSPASGSRAKSGRRSRGSRRRTLRKPDVERTTKKPSSKARYVNSARPRRLRTSTTGRTATRPRAPAS